MRLRKFSPLKANVFVKLKPMRFFLIFLLMASFAWSQAQTCLAELQQGLSEEYLTQEVTGFEAAQYLKATVDLLEPSLPQFVSVPDWFSLRSDAAEYELAKWLAERGLLVPEWQADSISSDVWEALLRNLEDWYGVQAASPVADLSHKAVTEALSATIDRVAPTLTPVALVASSAQNNKQVAFWAIIRNDSIYPRLIVYKPSSEPTGLDEGTKTVLPLLETCATKLKHFLFASEDVARGLFLSNHNGEMYVAASTPQNALSFRLVESGQEANYLTYQHPDTETLEHYAAVFTGDRIAATAVLRLLPRVRTNMNPKQVLEFVLGR